MEQQEMATHLFVKAVEINIISFFTWLFLNINLVTAGK